MTPTSARGMVPGESPVTEAHAPRHETPRPTSVLAQTAARLSRFHVLHWQRP